MNSLSVDIVEMDNKIKKIIMQSENGESYIKDITNCFNTLEKYYISTNSKKIETNNINIRKDLYEKMEERQEIIRKIKSRIESYKMTEQEVNNIFNKVI